MRVCLPPNYAYDLGGGDGRAENGTGNSQTTSAPKGDEGGDPNDDADGEAAAAPRLVSHGCSAAGAGSANWLAFAGWLLIAAAPLRESGYRLLMEILDARDDRSEALRTYERLRCMLRDELGTSPGSGARAIHERLLGQDVSREHPARRRRL